MDPARGQCAICSGASKRLECGGGFPHLGAELLDAGGSLASAGMATKTDRFSSFMTRHAEQTRIADWWFGTCFIFPTSWDDDPI